MFRAVRLRLIGYVVGVLALVLLAVGTLVFVLISRQLDDLVDAQLRATVARTPGVFGGARGIPGDEGTIEDGFVVQFVSNALPRGRGAPPSDATGWREVSHRGQVPPGLPDQSALDAVKPGQDDLRTVDVNGQSYRLLTRALGPQERQYFIAQAGISLEARDRQQRVVLLALGGGGALGLALTVAGGLFLTGRALAPLRLAFDRQRRFVGDASHELRTPLALLRLEAEDLAARTEPAAARPLLRQVDRVSRLVDDLLTLARLDERGLATEREPVHVASLLRTAAAQAQRLAAPDVHVQSDAPPSLWVLGDPDRLHQILLILVDNAARATPAGGRITLNGRQEGGTAVLTIADSGSGIPAEHLAHVFERFYRVDRARTRERGGAGLGLTIARDLVRAHDGEITISSPASGGTTVTVRLPATTVPEVEPAAALEPVHEETPAP